MASKSLALAVAQAQAKAQQGPKKKTKRPPRHKPKPGDVVKLRQNNAYFVSQLGHIMVVKEVLDKDRVVVECTFPGDEDFLGIQIVAFTRGPKGKTPNGSPKEDWLPVIDKIINLRERVIKKVVEVPAKRVITTQEELNEVLAQEGDHTNVVVDLRQP